MMSRIRWACYLLWNAAEIAELKSNTEEWADAIVENSKVVQDKFTAHYLQIKKIVDQAEVSASERVAMHKITGEIRRDMKAGFVESGIAKRKMANSLAKLKEAPDRLKDRKANQECISLVITKTPWSDVLRRHIRSTKACWWIKRRAQAKQSNSSNTGKGSRAESW